MRFLVDAQLPRRLSTLLNDHGHPSVHSSDLPKGNKTEDAELTARAVAENRIVVTKDNDFVDSHIITGLPPQLLLVTTGNLENNKLLNIFERNLEVLTQLFNDHTFIEINSDDITVHH